MSWFDEQAQSLCPDCPRQIRAPFITRPIGVGDVIKKLTQAVGIQPCDSCEQRAQMLNQKIQFRPWGRQD